MLSLNSGFPELVKNKECVDLFAVNAVQFLMENGFDGVDLNWEFPAWPLLNVNTQEKDQFVYLVRQLYSALKQSPNPLLLSLAVATPLTIVRRSYHIAELASNVDFISLMGYDFRMFKSYLPFVGHNAPLFRGSRDRTYFATLNIAWSAEHWLSNGASLDKLVIGIPTYGRTWKLLSSAWNSVGAPAVSVGINSGYVTYPEALLLEQNGAKRKWDEGSRVPYTVLGRNWVSHEDERSIYEKAEWIKQEGYSGIMTWNLNCDDYLGTVSGQKFKLHRVIREVMDQNN